MRNTEQFPPVENGAGEHEQLDQDVLNQLALENIEKIAGETAGPKVAEKERNAMKDRLEQLNKEIPALVEELNIVEEALGVLISTAQREAGAVDSVVAASKLSPEEYEKLMEARADLTDKIQPLQWERGNLEQVMHPDDYEQLARTRAELGLTQSGEPRIYRRPSGMVGFGPGAPEQPSSTALTSAPKKTGLIAKLKGLFGG